MTDGDEKVLCRSDRALRVVLHDHRERVIRWFFDPVEQAYVVLLRRDS